MLSGGVSAIAHIPETDCGQMAMVPHVMSAVYIAKSFR
jgi:hypothetical protein